MSDTKREYLELKLARGLILHQGHILLVKAEKEGGHYFLPGGKVDPGESVTVALVREFQEELAWAVRAVKFLGCYENSFQLAKKSGALIDILEINFIWTCERIDGNLSLQAPPSMEDKISFHWVAIDKLDSVRLLPDEMKQIIPRLAREADRLQTFWGTSLKPQVRGH